MATISAFPSTSSVTRAGLLHRPLVGVSSSPVLGKTFSLLLYFMLFQWVIFIVMLFELYNSCCLSIFHHLLCVYFVRNEHEVWLGSSSSSINTYLNFNGNGSQAESEMIYLFLFMTCKIWYGFRVASNGKGGKSEMLHGGEAFCAGK